MTTTFLLRGGSVVSMDPAIGNLPIGDVLVRDGLISGVAGHIDTPPGVEVVDASHRIVLPGFIDTHRHLWQTTFRGLLADATLGDYFKQIMIGLGPSVTADEVYAGTLLGAVNLLDAGITSVIDWANVINTPEHADAGIAALQRSGVRAMYLYGWPGGPEYLFNSSLGHPQDVRRVAAQYFSETDGLLTLGLGLRGPVCNPPEVLRSDWALARDLDARINVHTGNRVPGVQTSDIEILDELGLLGSDSTYVHCSNTTAAEFVRIRDTGGHVSVAAYCEMVMGHGQPPTDRLLQLGLRPSLSADIVATVPSDMFSLMRATYAHVRMSALPSEERQDFNPTVKVQDVLEFATMNGAHGLGMSEKVGSLTPGKQADIVLLRTDRPNAMPSIDPVATIVTQMDVSNVDSVYVAGRCVKAQGVLLDVDMDSLGSLADDMGERMNARLAAFR